MYGLCSFFWAFVKDFVCEVSLDGRLGFVFKIGIIYEGVGRVPIHLRRFFSLPFSSEL